MKPKMKVKMAIDTAMTAGILFMSGYQFWGDAAHERAGALLLILFIAHNLFNLNWYRNLFRGRYTPVRILQTAVNLLVLLSMVVQMYSGIVMSRHVFAFLPIDGGTSFARRLHILGAYWGFLLMSLHLGLHWNMILSMVRRIKGKSGKALPKTAGFAVGFIIAVYGMFVFFKRDFPTYLFLRSEFVFMDYTESPLFFYFDYLSLMGLWVFLAHYAAGLCRDGSSRQKRRNLK